MACCGEPLCLVLCRDLCGLRRLVCGGVRCGRGWDPRFLGVAGVRQPRGRDGPRVPQINTTVVLPPTLGSRRQWQPGPFAQSS